MSCIGTSQFKSDQIIRTLQGGFQKCSQCGAMVEQEEVVDFGPELARECIYCKYRIEVRKPRKELKYLQHYVEKYKKEMS